MRKDRLVQVEKRLTLKKVQRERLIDHISSKIDELSEIEMELASLREELHQLAASEVDGYATTNQT